jgi:peptidoglycan/LPS O-acetylase OafA/YrhL
LIVVVRRRFVGLNGLKGIALIAIVLYHCDQGTLRGGFLGVDIFFTISGFLIFSSLLNHIDSGKGIGFKEYYLKRLRRIYPALILMIPVTVSLAWFINQDMLVDINNQIVTAMLGCYNWYAIGSGASYFSQMNPDMFRHLWFMSVLMQFYLLAPLLIYLLRKILVRWVPVAVLAGLAVCSALSMGLQYHPGTDPTRVYFGSDTHAMGLWLGAMLAWLLMIIRRGNGRPEETAIMERARLVWSKIGPAAAFVALLILLWMMQHVEQGPAAFYGGIFAASLLTWSARWCATSSPRSASSWTKRRTPPVPRNRASSPPRIPRSPSASFRPTRSWQSPASPRQSQKQAKTLTATSSPSERGDPAVK